MTSTETASGEVFEIEELDLEPHDWDRGIKHMHAIRYRDMTIVVITGPGRLMTSGTAVGPDIQLSLDNAAGHARAQHYKMLASLRMVPPLGPIRQKAGA